MHNPCRDVTLPTIRSQREHAADPADAALMILALPERDQCAWALAFYAGLRLGELRALRWEDIDESAGLIHVKRSWDAREGEIDPKSFAGRRDVPIIGALRPFLSAQRALCAWQPTGLVLGTAQSTPFSYNGLYRRSAKAWKAAGFPRVTPHQARHSFASYLIAAGADVKAVTEIMGHASVRQSFDRYGHLLRDSHANTVTKLDALLLAYDTHGRVAQIEESERRSKFHAAIAAGFVVRPLGASAMLRHRASELAGCPTDLAVARSGQRVFAEVVERRCPIPETSVRSLSDLKSDSLRRRPTGVMR